MRINFHVQNRNVPIVEVTFPVHLGNRANYVWRSSVFSVANPYLADPKMCTISDFTPTQITNVNHHTQKVTLEKALYMCREFLSKDERSACSHSFEARSCSERYVNISLEMLPWSHIQLALLTSWQDASVQSGGASVLGTRCSPRVWMNGLLVYN